MRLQICVVGRAPRSQVQFCGFLSRASEARRDLTWAEVSVLEALRFAAYASRDWDTCVEMITDGSAVSRLGADAHLRSDALREAGLREPRAGKRFRQRLDDLTAAMPQSVTASAG